MARRIGMIAAMHEREHAPAGDRSADRTAGPVAREPRAASLLRMQASAGNRATARWLAREKVEGPSRSLLEGEVTDGAAGMAQAAAGRELRTAKDDDTRAGAMLAVLGIPPAAEGQPKPVPDEATKNAAEAAAGLAMAGAEMGAAGVIENLLRGGGPKTTG
jgi:hypothetical protein